MLSETSQTERDKYCVIALTYRILKQTNKQTNKKGKTKPKPIDFKNRLVVTR